MFIITAVPLKRGITIDSLSYFSSTAYDAGTIVQIPVREQMILGLVTNAEAVSAAKTAIRAATFSLKKLPQQVAVGSLGKNYIKTAEILSEYYACPLGTILYNLLPPEIRAGDIPIPHTHRDHTHSDFSIELFQATRSERYRAYRSLVRETFAHAGSVLCVVPSSHDAEMIAHELGQGIHDRLVILTSTATKSEVKRAYESLEDFSKTKLIIATPSHAVIERHDITVVIIEQARSPYYTELSRPYLDYRFVLKTHAKQTGRRVILGDLLPRTEEEILRRNDVYHTFSETPKRLELPGKLEVVSMEQKTGTESTFKLLSDEALKLVKETRKKKGNIFLFTARRGLAPLVSCIDCGYIFRSKESGAPYSLIRTVKNGVEERWFVCSASGERIRAKETCDSCGSWRLRERGIGIQHVHDELHKLLPNVPIILFDHLTARTYKKATFLRDKFYESKGAILLGTHMAIPYLTRPIESALIVNMDALLATPTWRLEEENLALLLTLREISKGTVLIQTRTPETELFTHARMGTTQSFYSEEIELRKKFNYPPFTTFIHLTWQGPREVVKQIEKNITDTFSEYTPTLYPNPTAPPETPIMYCLMRIPQTAWPDAKLVALLRSLPPSVRIMINPDKIV